MWGVREPGSGQAVASGATAVSAGSLRAGAKLCVPFPRSFIAVENIDSYCVLISSKAVYFLKSGDYVDREAIFLEVKYDDLYHCLVSKDHGKVYVQVTKKAVNTSSGVSIPGPSHQKPMVSGHRRAPALRPLFSGNPRAGAGAGVAGPP